MYGKLFASLYHGTLRGRAHEILVFTNLIAHADRYGYVDKHFNAIAQEVGLSREEVEAAIQKLEAPDPESRSTDLNGARLERIDAHRTWGWRIVNHGKYRSIRNIEDRREQNRIAQAAYREKSKQNKPPSAYAEAEAEAEAEGTVSNETVPLGGCSSSELKQKDPPRLEDALVMAHMEGIPQDCAEKWWNDNDARNWLDSRGIRIEKWKSSLRGYFVSWRSYHQKQPTTSPSTQTSADPYWKTKTRLDLVSGELKAIVDRSGRDAMGTLMISDKDKPNYLQLKKQLAELKKQLGLTQ